MFIMLIIGIVVVLLILLLLLSLDKPSTELLPKEFENFPELSNRIEGKHFTDNKIDWFFTNWSK